MHKLQRNHNKEETKTKSTRVDRKILVGALSKSKDEISGK